MLWLVWVNNNLMIMIKQQSTKFQFVPNHSVYQSVYPFTLLLKAVTIDILLDIHTSY